MRRERGQALIETILLGLLLLAPLLWALTILADLHRAALGTAAAAREGGFVASRSLEGRRSLPEARRTIDRALDDHGLDPAKAQVRWSLRSDRGAPVEVVVSYAVPALRAPFLGRVSAASIWIHAKHVARIDPFRSRGP